jgi:hypothetical protein
VKKLLAWRHPGFSAHVGETIAPTDKLCLEDTAAYLRDHVDRLLDVADLKPDRDGQGVFRSDAETESLEGLEAPPTGLDPVEPRGHAAKKKPPRSLEVCRCTKLVLSLVRTTVAPTTTSGSSSVTVPRRLPAVYANTGGAASANRTADARRSRIVLLPRDSGRPVVRRAAAHVDGLSFVPRRIGNTAARKTPRRFIGLSSVSPRRHVPDCRIAESLKPD